MYSMISHAISKSCSKVQSGLLKTALPWAQVLVCRNFSFSSKALCPDFSPSALPALDFRAGWRTCRPGEWQGCGAAASTGSCTLHASTPLGFGPAQLARLSSRYRRRLKCKTPLVHVCSCVCVCAHAVVVAAPAKRRARGARASLPVLPEPEEQDGVSRSPPATSPRQTPRRWGRSSWKKGGPKSVS